MRLVNHIPVYLAALMVAAPAYAGFHEGDAVTLDGQPVFHVAGFGGMSAQHRAWVTQDRLDNALFLSADKSPSTVAVRRVGGAICVNVGGRNVVTADCNSAKEEGMSADQLANKWADSIRNFLADNGKAALYIAGLKRPSALGATVAVVERRLYAPAGTSLPITLSTALNSANARAGDQVEGIITRDVMLGNYAIPEKSVVLGELVERRPGQLDVVFNTLRLPSGTELPIAANMVDTYEVASRPPHPVVTIGMPANEMLNCRVPASIAIGATSRETTTTVALRTNETTVIAAGQPFSVVLDSVTPVAVITHGHEM